MRQLLPAVAEIARLAARPIMRVYASDFTAKQKADGSPVTEADTASERIIQRELKQLTPDVPIVAEESDGVNAVIDGDARFWLVDPLDGTREFLKRNDEFCICIGLIEQRRPIFGVLYGPALDVMYMAAGPGTAEVVRDGGAAQAIACRQAPKDGLDVVGSRSHAKQREMQAFLNDRPLRAIVPLGSALKFGLVAEGRADLYPRLGPTCEWDTAAGHAIVVAAGGRMTTIDGDPFTYGKPKFLNPGFVVTGRPG